MFYWRGTTGDADLGGGVGGVADLAFTAATSGPPPGVDAATRPVGDTADGHDDPADFGDFNLGGHVGDDPAAVQARRGRLADAMGVPRSRLLFMAQCHGSRVVRVEGPWDGDPPPADGVVTTGGDLALAVLVADCVPVLLADPDAGVIGAVHAGRPGFVAGIVDEAVQAMAQAGAGRLVATVGPSVCGRCYEVPAAMRDEVAAVSPVTATVSWTGTPAVDVAAGVVDRLSAHGVAITWVRGCTRESDRLYSYRRRARTGRFAGVIRWAPR